MSEKKIETALRAFVTVSDDCGSPLSLTIDDKGGDYARAPLTVNEARALARALDAFAEIHG